nr:RecName: Full=Putative antimicrobial peptide 2; Short=Ls-AMP2 [Lippia origanoides]
SPPEAAYGPGNTNSDSGDK